LTLDRKTHRLQDEAPQEDKSHMKTLIPKNATVHRA